MNKQEHHHHHGAPDPIHITNDLAKGRLEIINTPDGEKISANLSLRVIINRPDGLEVLVLNKMSDVSDFISDVAPKSLMSFRQSLK